MKRRIAVAAGIALFMLCGAPGVRAQADSCWSLEQCLRAAMANAPRLRASAQVVVGAQAAAREAVANRWPTLGVSGAYAYTSDTQEIRMTSPVPGYVPPKIRFYNDNVYDLAMTARVPIYAGGALREKARAESFGGLAAALDLRADSLKLASDVRRAYFNALGGEARVEAARQSARRLERHLQELTSAQNIGTVSEETRLMALSRLRQAEQAVLSAEADAQAARLALGNLVVQPGLEIHPAAELDAAIADSALTPLPLKSRVEVSAAQMRLDQSLRLTRTARAALLPSLSGLAAYHYAKPGVNMTENEWMDYYTLGLTASWTLWDWRARSQRVGQARAAAGALDARMHDLVNTLNTRYETALAARRAAGAVLAIAAERAAIERRRLDLVEGRMQQGMASESEFLDTHDDLTAAETDLISATARLRLAEADLLYAAGY
ncbi:MAG: TolC family protein [bacterium]|nr:TolC family protein [bacterium]